MRFHPPIHVQAVTEAQIRGDTMGTDCTMVVEMLDMDFLPQKEYWEIAGVIHINRDYDLFEEIKDMAIPGYPDGINYLSKSILEKYECWGECWLPMKKVRKLKYIKRHDECDIFKKNLHGYMRCIFRFDN